MQESSEQIIPQGNPQCVEMAPHLHQAQTQNQRP